MIEVKAKVPSFRKLSDLGRSWAEAFRKSMQRARAAARQPQRRRPITSRSGELFGSVNLQLTEIGGATGRIHEARLGSSLWRAAFLEYGATIPARRIEAVHGGALRFTIGGAVVFRQFANIPQVRVPPHPFLRPSMRAALRGLRKEMVLAIKAATQEGGTG